MVADSAVRNFFMDAIWPAPNLYMEKQPYTESDRLVLARSGLGGPAQRRVEGGEAAYDRIICVFVESLSQCFVAGPEALRLPAFGMPLEKAEVAALPAAMPFLATLLHDDRNITVAGYRSSAFSTNDAIYSALASRPDFGGDSLARRSMETVFSLAGAKGYQTAFFLGSSGEFGHLAKNYRRLLKVETVFDKDSSLGLPPATRYSHWGETDARVFEKVLTWVRNNADERFVIGISTIDTHPPFDAEWPPPPGFADTPLTRSLFSTDTAIAAFVGALRREGLLDARTLLVITADHQITHGGKAALDALPNGEFGDRSVPLVFVSGDIVPLQGMVAPALCSAVDLAPTLGDLLGLPEQASYYGKSLFLESGHYDLALTRDGMLFFTVPDEPSVSFKLSDIPKAEREQAIRKWYFNTQQGYRELQ